MRRGPEHEQQFRRGCRQTERAPGCRSRLGCVSVFPITRDGQMLKLKNAVVNFLKAEDGPTAVEYAVMLALIIVVWIAAISALGSNASNTFNYVGNKVATTSS